MKEMNKNGGTMRLVLIFSFLLLGACQSEWNEQDPFARDADAIRKAVPQGQKEKGVPPLQSVIFIDTKSSYTMQVGEKLTIPVSYRITHPEFQFERVDVGKIGDILPGATYDPQEGVIEFEAKTESVENSLIRSIPVVISVYAKYKGLLHVVKKTTMINILQTDTSPPVIERVSQSPGILKEGQTHSFKVFVRDEVSPKGPTLSVSGRGLGEVNGAQFVDFDTTGREVFGSPGLWSFDAKIDLRRSHDITKSRTLFLFEFIAHSVFGVPSDSKRERLDVYTTASKPQFVLPNNKTFKVNEVINFSFLVADTKQEGRVFAEFTDSCSALSGATCACQRITYGSQCSVSWTPQAAGRYRVPLKAENRVNVNTTQTETAISTASLSIEVTE